MRVLVIGSGGREHALAWKFAASPSVDEVLVAPGNAGTALEPRVRNVAVEPGDIDGLIALARREQVGLTLPGPEGPLVAGIVDRFTAAGLPCFGPGAATARLEGSKAFAKNFLERHGIPTARARRFDRDSFDPGYLARLEEPIVVKASGLAAGKGVVVAATRAEALAAAESMLQGALGAAGSEILIEEFLPGEEASFIVLAAGEQVLPLATSQDHKRLGDGDRGPNTGGMGAYSPAPVVTPAVHARVMDEVIRPTLRGLAAEGMPYSGFLYAGLMIGPDGTPRVIEFNCRLGDPETQPLLMRLESDLVAVCRAAMSGRLDNVTLEWNRQVALGVVLAAEGYPGAVRRGDPVAGLDRAARLPGKLFHAGTRLEAGRVLTHGGRVLCAVGLGNGFAAAREQAYALADCVRFDGMHLRRDIGHRALSR